MGYIFISYGSEELETAMAVKNLLDSNGLSTWMAPNDIPIGSRYGQVINQTLRDCSCVLLVLTEASVSSAFVRREIERAISFGKPIVPLEIEDVELDDELEFFLAGTHVMPVKRIDGSAAQIYALIEMLKDLTSNEVAISSYSDSFSSPPTKTLEPTNEAKNLSLESDNKVFISNHTQQRLSDLESFSEKSSFIKSESPESETIPLDNPQKVLVLYRRGLVDQKSVAKLAKRVQKFLISNGFECTRENIDNNYERVKESIENSDCIIYIFFQSDYGYREFRELEINQTVVIKGDYYYAKPIFGLVLDGVWKYSLNEFLIYKVASAQIVTLIKCDINAKADSQSFSELLEALRANAFKEKKMPTPTHKFFDH